MNLPVGWERTTLRALGVEARPGFASGKHNQDGDGVPHLRPMNVTRTGNLDLTDVHYVLDDSDRRVMAGDILFNNTNSPALVGKTAMVNLRQPAAFSNHMTRLRVPKGIVPKFLAIQLHQLWMDGYFQTILNNHVNQASVATERLLDTNVIVPPTAEQCRIVETLDDLISHLDSALPSLTHARTLIMLQRRALYTLATEGRLLVGNSIATPDFSMHRQEAWKAVHRDKSYKKPAGANLQDAPSRPEDWKVFSLEELTDPIRIIRYGILMPKVKSGGTVPYVEVKDLKDCILSGKRLRLTSSELDEQFAGARIQPGDVLLAVRGSYDRSAVVTPNLARANVSRDVARIAPLPGVDPQYLHLYLQSHFAQQYLKKYARGVAVKGVNISSIRAMPVAIPSLEMQRRIVEAVQQQLTILNAAEKAVQLSLQRGATLRQALLHRALNGQLTYQDANDEPSSVLLDRVRAAQKADGHATKRAACRSRKGISTGYLPPPPRPSAPTPVVAIQQELPL